LLATKRIRDTTTAAHHLEPDMLRRSPDRENEARLLVDGGHATPGDLRAEYLPLPQRP
jgi:hypothetical protein